MSAAEQGASERLTRAENEDEESAEHDSDAASNSETKSEYSDEPEMVESDWPLLYQIMDVDPEILDRDIEPMLNK